MGITQGLWLRIRGVNPYTLLKPTERHAASKESGSLVSGVFRVHFFRVWGLGSGFRVLSLGVGLLYRAKDSRLN